MKVFFFYVFIFISLRVHSQVDSAELYHMIEGGQWVSADVMNNIFVERQGWLIRMEPNRRADSIKLLNYGNFCQKDLKWALKKLLFFPENYTLYTIGSRMGEVAKVQLNQLPLIDISHIKYSPDGFFWMLDASLNSLYKINENLEIKAKSFINERPNSQWQEMEVLKNGVILLDSTKGLYWLDELGWPIGWTFARGIKSIWSIRENVFFETDSSLMMIRLNQSAIKILDLDTIQHTELPKSIFEWRNNIWYWDSKKLIKIK